jgi:hypothetical protein
MSFNLFEQDQLATKSIEFMLEAKKFGGSMPVATNQAVDDSECCYTGFHQSQDRRSCSYGIHDGLVNGFT